ARTFVYGDGMDEVLAMYNPPRAAAGDPNDLLDLVAFSETWLADPNDQNFDEAWDINDDDAVNLLDYITLAENWTYSTERMEKRWYYFTDALGSVMGLVGSHENAESEFYLYDAYGQPYGESEAGNPYFFTARRLDFNDDGQNLKQLNRHRYYDYELGRWMSNDPLGITVNSFNGKNTPLKQYITGLNLYQYCNSSPILYIDPDGKNPIIIVIGIGIALFLEGCSGNQTQALTWDKSCNCAKDITLIKKLVKDECNKVSSTIKDKKLRDCIDKSCKTGRIRCSILKGRIGGNVDSTLSPALGISRKIILYPNKYENGQYGSLNAGEIAIHEFAHGCGWVHGEGKGVPGDSGYADDI
ncbi:MAG: RHS repeat-associated core domain-containing protein, partial [Spirochaetes bacterium]|nr:RHS repeat-associated core domain-containing protein [Spirochaetota bacterium]